MFCCGPPACACGLYPQVAMTQLFNKWISEWEATNTATRATGTACDTSGKTVSRSSPAVWTARSGDSPLACRCRAPEGLSHQWTASPPLPTHPPDRLEKRVGCTSTTFHSRWTAIGFFPTAIDPAFLRNGPAAFVIPPPAKRGCCLSSGASVTSQWESGKRFEAASVVERGRWHTSW